MKECKDCRWYCLPAGSSRCQDCKWILFGGRHDNFDFPKPKVYEVLSPREAATRLFVGIGVGWEDIHGNPVSEEEKPESSINPMIVIEAKI